MPTAHLARHASLRPLEIWTCCSKKSTELEPGDTVVFLPEIADCDACEVGRRAPVCAGKRHVAPSLEALTCQCGERKIDRTPSELAELERKRRGEPSPS